MLVDIYIIDAGDSAKVLSITNNVIIFRVSEVANNSLIVKSDGLHVDISGKADQVTTRAANPYNQTTEADKYAAYEDYNMNNDIALLMLTEILKIAGVRLLQMRK